MYFRDSLVKCYTDLTNALSQVMLLLHLLVIDLRFSVWFLFALLGPNDLCHALTIHQILHNVMLQEQLVSLSIDIATLLSVVFLRSRVFPRKCNQPTWIHGLSVHYLAPLGH